MQSHDGVANYDEEECLHERHPSHVDDFRPDVASVRQVEKAFSLQQGTILDDFLRAAAHARKCCHDNSHEEVAHQVLVVHHRVTLRRGEACEQSADDSQQRCDAQGDGEILHIRNLGLDVTMQEDGELLECVRFLLVRLRHVEDSWLRHFLTVLQIELMPVLWCHLSFVRKFSRIVQRLLVNDVKHNLRIDIATSWAGAGFRVNIIGCLLEIGDGINRVSVKHGVSTLVEQPQAVEELIDIARRLMDVDHDEFALERLFFQQENHLLGVGRRQSRRRFVEEEHGGFAYQLQGDVQSLALSSRYVFVDGRAHLQVLRRIESQVLQRLLHAVVDFLFRQTLEAQSGSEPKVLIDSQFLNEQVVLRHVANQVLRFGLRYVVSVDGDASLLWLQRAVEQGE